GESRTLPNRIFRGAWRRPGAGTATPVVRREGAILVVRPNDAHVASGYDNAQEFRLGYGEVLQVGGRVLRVGALVQVGVDVRNVFGTKRTDTVDAVIFPT